ncbi:hypothetical protein K493DRAFT_340961 [Basidiobolus meristosporus CBS 931.73]|uniref:Zn(2)-C6 fungal-type domain-containing protein n=1 Tax=Basidiobolus meristosporus CBS 931.73 TaxID=1314790 RepID=A0A1Y1XT93_9FUNG|nr:hypothetical protein K493DRAFT_340961 [Basidiobolus meristosporus CBS 931.73]|eukprot:ORX88950.1 hypothetical protein K493DRAFT_340961 [Basidiobolus meristosporus CBS 931.73]
MSDTATATQEPAPRKKLQPACNDCHRRKVKCTFERPQCSNCKRRGNKCWYPEKKQKKQATKADSDSLVEERLKRLESLLLNANIQPGANSSEPTSPADLTAPNDTDLKHKNASFFTLPEKSTRGLETNVIHHLDRRRFVIKDGQMPQQEIRERLIDLYFKKLHHLQPLIHPKTFMEREKQGKNSDLLILAICATSSIFLEEVEGVSDTSCCSGEPFASRAQHIIQENLMKPSLETIQALGTLFVYEFTAGNFGISQMYLELAFHYLKLFRIYRLDEDYQDDTLLTPSDWVEKETKRRIFWLTVIKDRIFSCEMGIPQLVDLFDCEVQLPCEEYYWENSLPIFNAEKMDSDEEEMALGMSLKPTNATSSQSNQFSIKLKIILILGQISRYANRPKTKRILSKRSLTARFTLLEYALSAWWQHLPADVKSESGLNADTAAFELIQHYKVLYYGATILLHRTYLAHMAHLFNSASPPLPSSSSQDTNVSVPESCLTSMNKCTSTAFAITQIITHFNSFNHSYFNLFSSHAVFLSSTIHLNNMFSSTGELAQRSKEAFDLNFKFLQDIRGFRPLTEFQLEVLNKLKLVCSNINRRTDLRQHPGTISMQWIAPTSTGAITWQDTLEEAFKRYCSTSFRDFAATSSDPVDSFPSSPDNPFRVGFSQDVIPLPEPNPDLNGHQQCFTYNPGDYNSSQATAFSLDNNWNTNPDPLNYDQLLIEKIYQESGLSSDSFDFFPLFNNMNSTNTQL